MMIESSPGDQGSAQDLESVEGLVLTMIVRDEERVIERCIESVRPIISGYVICDTGSVDGTVERIERVTRGLPGVIHHEPWVDFGTNRTRLAELARGIGDHHLLLDADMTLEYTRPLPRFGRESAYLVPHSGEVEYFAPRIVDARHPWHWRGSTHEILDSSRPFQRRRIESVRVVHHGDGAGAGRRRLIRDRELLERDLAKNPDSPRAGFYLGLVLLGLGDVPRATSFLTVAAEDARLSDDTRYYASLRLVECAARSGTDAIDVARRTVALDPDRAEGWLALSYVLRRAGRFHAALRAARRARTRPDPEATNFVFSGAGTWRADLATAAAHYALGRTRAALDLESARIADTSIPPRGRALAHRQAERTWMWRHGARRALSRRAERDVQRLRVDEAWELHVDAEPRWWLTNPSIISTADGYLATAKLTNLASSGGPYERRGRSPYVGALNVRFDIDPAMRLRAVDPVPDPGRRIETHPAPVQGVEDLRLVEVDGTTFMLGWSREFSEHGASRSVLLDDDARAVTVLPSPRAEFDEKNWMPFVRNGRLHLITLVDPLRVYEVAEEGGLCLVEAGDPVGGWVTWRGGSQGIRVDDGWMFVIHERFSAGSKHRFTHRFLMIGTDLRLIAVSPAFSISGRPVEFVTGIAAAGEGFLIGLGVGDRRALLVTVSKDEVMGRLDAIRPGRAGRRRIRDLGRWPQLLHRWDPAPVVLPPDRTAPRTTPVADRWLPATAEVEFARVAPAAFVD
ncbi:MAG: hypothetical protein R3290_10650 [Acidimicrobiia bacterium]|nr:hypothetical protein [Acidimicrobiia bacterium]